MTCPTITLKLTLNTQPENSQENQEGLSSSSIRQRSSFICKHWGNFDQYHLDLKGGMKRGHPLKGITFDWLDYLPCYGILMKQTGQNSCLLKFDISSVNLHLNWLYDYVILISWNQKRRCPKNTACLLYVYALPVFGLIPLLVMQPFTHLRFGSIRLSIYRHFPARIMSL